ncbi:YjiH family protein [Moraxella catarrhalis]|nr:YjiH family protein [Moraxella catarrhalis]RKM23639.1 YjiH family protein [Moraxella catarrhalis]
MNDSSKVSDGRAILQMLVFSSIGVFMFFVPFEIAGKSTILFDHAASYLVKEQRTLSLTFLFLLMIYGVIKPIISGDFKRSVTDLLLSLFKLCGLILATLYLLDMLPDVVMQKDMMPFLFEKLALPVGIIVPIGALILAFLVGFGLLEMVGVLMQPIMRPLFKTPGSSAIDAVASFVGSYSIGLLITNRVYLEGKYSAKEAMIIATGFSTVSAAFMVIVAKTLGLMDDWNLFFWSTLIITFAVTAITARLPPISLADDVSQHPESYQLEEGRLKTAFKTGMAVSKSANNIPKLLWSNIKDGLQMSAAIVPSIIAVGLFGLLLSKYTPVFDALGLLLYPFTWLLGFSEPMLAAKGISSGLAEMFLPALLLAETDLLTRYVAAVVCVSSVIFFSALIPCVLATKIPLSVAKMLVIWLQRAILSILLAGLFGRLVIVMGWLG